MRPNFEELDELLAQAIIIRMFHNSPALAWARKAHVHNFANLGGRPVCHAHDAIRQDQRFIHVVSHHEGSDLVSTPQLDEHLLQLVASERIEHTEGLFKVLAAEIALTPPEADEDLFEGVTLLRTLIERIIRPQAQLLAA